MGVDQLMETHLQRWITNGGPFTEVDQLIEAHLRRWITNGGSFTEVGH